MKSVFLYISPKYIRYSKFFFLISLLIFLSCHTAFSQTLALKTNALYWATTTPNLGLELITAPKWSLELQGGYNPWDLGNEKQIKHWAIQSEMRYWLCEAFEGHFFGVHLQGGEYNIQGMQLPSSVFGENSKDYRFQGHFAGIGVSYGYQWLLSNRWSLEANIGFGYNYVRYEKFESEDCGCSQGWTTASPGYFGPTKLGLSFIYLIK